MNSLIIEGLMYAGLFTGGFSLIAALCGHEKTTRNLLAAFPLGIGLWATCWMVTTLPFGYDPGYGSLRSAVVLYLLVVVYLSKCTRLLTPSNIPLLRRFSASMVAVVVLGFLASWSRIYFLSFDSHIMINWASNPRYSLTGGFPLPNLAIASLSRLVRVDFYLYGIHALCALSLLLLGALTIFDAMRKRDLSRSASLMWAILIQAVMATSYMFLLQSVFVNHHVTTAIYLLLFFNIALDEKPHATMAAVCLFLSVITRMEGILFALLAIVCVSGMPNRARTTFAFSVAWRFAIMIFPYIAYLTFICWKGGFITGHQYLVLYGALLGFLTLLALRHFDRVAWGLNHLWLLMAAGLSILSLTLFGWKYEHMRDSSLVFFANFFDPNFYGYAHHFIIFTLTVCLFVRRRNRTGCQPYDGWMVFFVSGLWLNIVLVAFREPFHRSWQDSATRLFIHFLPLAMVWIGFNLAHIIRPNALDESHSTRHNPAP